ncbi:class I adenylate-forming enzyme family protein [Paraburkholderia sp. GAS32]|uniref:class I adenylate-forming enzyme family protein n=1 Tax=Paraburkholderia sp. GAS32 TaxID=3035129 RepID=UPI003D2017A4
MSSMSAKHLGERIRSVLLLQPDAVAVEAGHTATTWKDLSRAAEEIESLLVRHGVDHNAPIGWVARNRPAAVASFVSLLIGGRMVVPLRPRQASATFAAELAAQQLCAVLADDDDWSEEGVVAAAAEAGTLGIVVSGSSPVRVSVHPQLSAVGAGPHRDPMPGYILERLTSGTTGAPKRIPVREDVLIPSLQSAEQRGKGETEGELRVKRSPAILLKPFSHAGGLFGLLLALYQARPMVLLEKFVPDEWARAVERYQIKSASLVPAMIQMILEAGIEPLLLKSLKAVRAGTAPLDAQVQLDFEQRYNVPILVDYGAAEFIGGVAGWTLEDHRRYASNKRRSVGRARSDVLLQVAAPDAPETALPAGQIGVLSVRCDRFGPDWIRTNDLASIDEDGFLFLHGRADDAINRGGFKILPEEVAAVLRRYPGVRDAAVIGKADRRLGEVPVAAIEMTPGAVAPTVDELIAFARQALTAYMIPTEFRIVEALPRTASMKVSRPDLKALLGV